jgi:hypothetical protein
MRSEFSSVVVCTCRGRNERSGQIQHNLIYHMNTLPRTNSALREEVAEYGPEWMGYRAPTSSEFLEFLEDGGDGYGKAFSSNEGSACG